ncbi:MAG: RnfABCDGE type electron transport complex subunit D [Treponema sp.]|uniref:RnfABCDGE type electron transport complex subunit D n=1 Tax=Treponema sp. TaxID=166 RepID=UPI001B4079C8|nr:RnfABCDGE type electron transport complex subunit D [Treponema sp.]MBP5402178.1 RnfABCDGE type electron transport complex subunit D [Treponema sp.]MBR5933058.1 RnfABCDGE type electron transport complex subunit D [Treponema sp.]
MQETYSNEIYLSPTPHFSSRKKTKQIMLLVILSLLPECVAGIFYFGIPALTVILVSVGSCVLFETLFCLLIKKPVSTGDFSAVITGLLLALTLPPTIPLWMVVLGSFFAIIAAKAFFGGIGCNVWNPALTGRAFLVISFPLVMGSGYVLPGADAVSSATPLAKTMPLIQNYSKETLDYYWTLFTGNHAGCIGETCIALILISAVFLLITKVIDFRAPLAMLLTCTLLSAIAKTDVLYTLMSGGLLFGAVFMATDYTTAPVTKPGRLIFGAGCGLITFLIRQFGGYPEGVMFSILIMNSLVPFLNNVNQRKYGYTPKRNIASRLKKGNTK